MRTLIRGTALVALLVTAPAVGDAQRRAAVQPSPGARHELGMDVGLAWYNPDGGDSGLRFGAPLDLRVGFVPRGRLMFEPRLALSFDSQGGLPDGGSYVITPGVNVVHPLGRRNTHRSGMFLTGGAGLNMVDVGALGGTGVSLNGGVGWRKTQGGIALRYAFGLQYDTEIEDSGVIVSPSTVSVGARLGLSFWR